MGHAYSALLNAFYARQKGGTFLIRIEDIDQNRCTPALIDACLEDLAWLGLTSDQPILRQSQHLPRYQQAISYLEEQELLYPCFCTRRQLSLASSPLERDPDGVPLYAGTCRALTADEVKARQQKGEVYSLRLDMARALAAIKGQALFWQEDGHNPAGELDSAGEEGARKGEHITAHPARWGDVILVRKDCPASYHLCVVLDDAFQGITQVIRGQDLFEATALHRLLQVLLGLKAPHYLHHGLIRGEASEKLSKSLHSPALRQMRMAGVSAAEIKHQLGFAGA